MRILIADDEPVSRMVLQETLRKLGHEVTATADGIAAWAAFEAEPFPIVISDWMMPELDGPGLCRRIRRDARPRYTFVVLLTALSGKRNYLEGMEAGADEFVSKPFDPDELQARLRMAERVLGLQEQVHQLEGLLPICSYCKKIRDDDNAWTQMEQYISQRTEAAFSHGICPECYEKHIVPQLEQMRGKVS